MTTGVGGQMTNEQKLLLIFGLIAQVFWIVQLIDLMSRKDNEFPGRFDKPTWVIILIFTNFLGAIAFLVSKPAKQVKPSIDTILPEPQPAEPTICADCGATIPSDSSKCPSCGWSYEAFES
jgi:hypothetical protein